MMERLSLKDPVEPGTPANRLLEAALPLARAHREGDAHIAQRLLAEHPEDTAAEVVDRLRQAILERRAPDDDISVVVIRRTE